MSMITTGMKDTTTLSYIQDAKTLAHLTILALIIAHLYEDYDWNYNG